MTLGTVDGPVLYSHKCLSLANLNIQVQEERELSLLLGACVESFMHAHF